MRKRKAPSLFRELVLPLALSTGLLVVGTIVSATLIYQSNVEETSEGNFRSTGEQILGTYDSYFTQIFRNSDVLISAYNAQPLEDLGDSNPMTERLESVLSIRPEIISAGLYDVDTGLPFAKAGKGNLPENGKGENWFEETHRLEEDKLISFLSVPLSQSEAYPYLFTLSRYAPFEKDPSHDAVLRLDFSWSEIVNTLSDAGLSEGNSFLIYDKDYSEVYSSIREGFDEKKAILQDLIVGDGTYPILGHDYFVFSSSISQTSWRLAVFLNRDSVTQAINLFILWNSLIGFGVTLMAILIASLIARRASRPLALLSQEMRQIVSLEDMPTRRIEVSGAKEIVALDLSFQAMIARIDELTKHVLREKEEQRKSELLALQNQINPHFLYNTLDSIMALIDSKENEKASEMIVALSRFFRISISRGQNIIPLKNELSHAKNYLLIQKLRFGDSFSYRFEVEPGLEEIQVVKLILQPLIENAINHGLKEGEEGHILVSAKKVKEELQLSVRDDGYGIKIEEKEALLSSFRNEVPAKGVGLKNVYLRLRLAYGPEADITIDSQLDIGTAITLHIPLKGDHDA